MQPCNENSIEQLAIERLQSLGYAYCYGPEIAPGSDRAERQSYSDILLTGRLQAAIDRLNPGIPPDARTQALREVTTIASPDLLSNNERFHTLLTDGIEVEFQENGTTRGDKVWLVDFEHPEENEFLVVNQFTIAENHVTKRPDVILFVNGLPLVVVELKNPTDEHATVKKAFDQLQTYKAVIPSLFTYNALLVISDGLDAKAGSLSAQYSRFSTWKNSDGNNKTSLPVSRLEVLIDGMLEPSVLLDLIRHFTVFEQSGKDDSDTGLTTVHTVKKIAAYHQYYAVNKAIESTMKAVASGRRKGGVVWHTQGSGKSLSMVFFTGKLVLKLDNPTVVVLTDRNDLDDQLFDTFAASTQLLRQAPEQANDREHLKTLLQVASGGIVFTTIQKFSPDNGTALYPLLSERSNIVVIADEAHRSQYGFEAKEVDIKDEQGNVIGKRTAYGFAKYIRDALPNATFLGFTGTPIENTDVNTPAIFGKYVDIYDIAQAVADGATVKIYYESRLARITLEEDGRELIRKLDRELDGEELSLTQKAKAKWTKLEAIVGNSSRLKNVAQDIVTHFETRQEAFQGKAMIVTMSRRIAVELYQHIIALHPGWHHDDLEKGAVKVVMTASSSDPLEMQQHKTTKQQRRQIAERLKDPSDELQMAIVCDMWLTGFDVPCLHTMYLDKPMKGHNLMQAIARVNRVYLDKPGGLIVDYLGIAADLKRALAFYAESGGNGSPTETQEDAVNLMLEKLEVVEQFFEGFGYVRYFDADTSQKLSIILQSEEHILSLEKGKERFTKEVTLLSKAFALAIPHELALDNKEKVAFFQAVKARLKKFEANGTGKTDAELETAIRQVVDKAIVSDQIVDIFDAAGIQKPEISILSDEFLEEVRGMKRRHLALELLKKLLSDEIKSRTKTNLVQSKALMEMLENVIRRYQNNLITAAEVINELLDLAKDIKKADQRGEDLGLSFDELAFYDALANNESAREVMGDDKLRELAMVLVDRVRKNTTIDWSLKESAKARMRIIVKRLLRKYGYPPDKQAIATEIVLEQAKLFADEWVKVNEC